MTEVREAPDAVTDVRDRHLAFYVDLARRGADGMDEEDNQSWRDLLSSEQDNFRSAMTWAIESGRTEDGMELAWALSDFWSEVEATSESRRWLERLLDADGAASAPRGRALIALAAVLWTYSEYEDAARRAEEAVRLLKEAGEEDFAGLALGWQAWALWYAGKVNACGPLFEESITILRKSSHADWLEHSIRGLGWYRLSTGDSERAIALHEEGERVLRAAGNRRWVSTQMSVHANIYYNLGRTDESVRLRERSLEIARELDQPLGIAWSASNLASDLVVLPGRRFEQAEELLGETLRIGRELDDLSIVSHALGGLATAAMYRGDLILARSLAQEALDHAHRIRDEVRSDWPKRQAHAVLAQLDLLEGRNSDARRHIEEGLAIHRRQSSDAWISSTLRRFATMLEDIAPDRSLALKNEAVSVMRDLQDERMRLPERWAVSNLMRSTEGPDAALPAAREAVEIAQNKFSGERIAIARANVAALLFELGDNAGARSELEKGWEHVESIGVIASNREALAAACVDLGDVDLAERYVDELGSGWHALALPREIGRLLETVAKIAVARDRSTDAAPCSARPRATGSWYRFSGTPTSCRRSRAVSTQRGPPSVRSSLRRPSTKGNGSAA